jgi:hypothetical protein
MPIRVLPGPVAIGIFGGVSGTELRVRWETDFCALGALRDMAAFAGIPAFGDTNRNYVSLAGVGEIAK